MGETEPLGGEPLIVCSVCEEIVNHANAEKRTVEGGKGFVQVWICKTCLRLGSSSLATKKYILKEQKKIGR